MGRNSARISRIAQRLEAIPKAVRTAAAATLKDAAEDLTKEMKRAVPVETGQLRDAIYMTPPGDRGLRENQAAVTAGNTETIYPSFVEYGTSHEPPSPWWWPTYYANKPRLRRKIRKGISDAVKRAWK